MKITKAVLKAGIEHATVKEEHHAGAAKMEKALAASDREKSAAHRTMSKAKAIEGTADAHATLADSFDKSADVHDGYSGRHTELSKHYGELKKAYENLLAQCEKSLEDSLSKIVPDGIRAVIPSSPGATMVPRAGQRVIEKTEVPLELEQIVGFDDLNW